MRTVLSLIKGPFTENYQRNLDQKGSFTRLRFYYRNYQEILIKKVLLLVKGSFAENY